MKFFLSLTSFFYSGGIVFDKTRSNVNYWEPWYLDYDPDTEREPGIPTDDNPRTGAYKQMIKDGYGPSRAACANGTTTFSGFRRSRRYTKKMDSPKSYYRIK